MKKIKMYKYIGYNGTVTTPVLLPNVDNKLEVYKLKASNGKILTNGLEQYYMVTVLPESVSEWYEIDDTNSEEA